MKEIKKIIAAYYYKNVDRSLNVSKNLNSILKIYPEETGSQIKSIYDISKLCEKKVVNQKAKGAFFTPRYISSYIARKIENGKCRIIDPACGCGNMLIAALERVVSINDISPIEALNYIYGIDIDEQNVYFTKILIELWCLKQGYSTNDITLNIKCADSLLDDWFDLEYQYIIGNPPYVNVRQMDKMTKSIYSDIYQSAKGLFDLSHLFVEKALKKLTSNGKMIFITINNILYSESSSQLRQLIDSKRLNREIIDIGETEVFDVSVKTCIISITNKNDNSFLYSKSSFGDEIEQFLDNCQFYRCCDWRGNTAAERKLLDNIMSHSFKLGKYVKGSIATLKDSVFIISDDNIVDIDGNNIKIEKEIIQKVYMGSKNIAKNIIYPYYPDGRIITEQELSQKFPNTYKYLLSRKNELIMRDNGNANPVSWYAYGRTQGIPLYNKVLVSGTYNKNPNFFIPEYPNALIHGGLAISADIPIKPNVLFVILNSDIMRFYISKVEYSLVGGYWTYNIKKIKKYSIPELTEEDEEYLLSHTKEETDSYLWKLYAGKENQK